MTLSSLWLFFESHKAEILRLTWQHLAMVLTALSLAVLAGVPLAVALTRRRRWAPLVLGLAATVQTIPSVALLGLLLLAPAVGGIGPRPAVAALFLYSMMAIVENTYVGIRQADAAAVDAGRGLGMTDLQVLWFIELPQALPFIVAGARISAVLCVATATVASYVGAGGLGDLVFRGVSRGNNEMVAWGALPAIGLSLSAHGLLSRAEALLTRRTRPR